MNIDFTLKKYTKLLELLSSSYSFQTFSEYLLTPIDRTIILRNDVDLKPQNSLKFAEIQNNYRTSYLPLCAYLLEKHKIEVKDVVPEEKKPFTKKFDPIKKTFLLSDYLTLATKKLHAAAQITHLEANGILEEYLNTFKFP